MNRNSIIIACFSLIILSIGLMVIPNNATNKKKLPEPLVSEDKATTMIKQLIENTAAFSVSIAHHLLPIKMRIWQKKGQINFPEGVSWDDFKKDVHQFEANLHTLLEKDQKGTSYNLTMLRSTHTLYRLLEKLSKASTYKEDAALNKLSQEKLPIKLEETRKLQRHIKVYMSIFYREKLLTLLQNFFKKLELHAKKLRQEEEKLQKIAERREQPFYDVQDYDVPDIEYSGEDWDF